MTNANISSKKCFKCGKVKPRSEFYAHGAMADGLLGKCKECTKKDANEHRLANLEKVRKYDRERAKNPHRIANAVEQNKRWRKEDGRRASAHNKVARAIRAGVIEKAPCCVCGSDNSLAHHESYDRPLDVIWYCQPHHKGRHKEMILKGIQP